MLQYLLARFRSETALYLGWPSISNSISCQECVRNYDINLMWDRGMQYPREWFALRVPVQIAQDAAAHRGQFSKVSPRVGLRLMLA
jgi:hypothetical protein